MTQADNIIPRDFNGSKIEFIEEKEDIWITAETLGIGLEYNNPRKDIMQLYYRHRDELEDYKGILKLSTPGGIQDTTVFNEEGAYLLIMFSNQPRAREFRKWIATVIKEIRKTGSYIEKAPNNFDLFIQQAEMIKKAFIRLKEQNEKLNLLENQMATVNIELKSFEQKYEDERIITPQTIKTIKDTVQYANRCTGIHWGTIYSKIWDAFNISSTTGISEKLGQKIIIWMKDHPFFKKYLRIKEV